MSMENVLMTLERLRADSSRLVDDIASQLIEISASLAVPAIMSFRLKATAFHLRALADTLEALAAQRGDGGSYELPVETSDFAERTTDSMKPTDYAEGQTDDPRRLDDIRNLCIRALTLAGHLSLDDITKEELSRCYQQVKAGRFEQSLFITLLDFFDNQVDPRDGESQEIVRELVHTLETQYDMKLRAPRVGSNRLSLDWDDSLEAVPVASKEEFGTILRVLRREVIDKFGTRVRPARVAVASKPN